MFRADKAKYAKTQIKPSVLRMIKVKLRVAWKRRQAQHGYKVTKNDVTIPDVKNLTSLNFCEKRNVLFWTYKKCFASSVARLDLGSIFPPEIK